MTTSIWIAIIAQVAMGAFDTLFHHEGVERLAWRPSQRRELQLHGVRNLAYGAIFLLLGWMAPGGDAARALLVLMTCELGITLWDFIEEDRSRKLPATERIVHTVMALNFGVILALLVPLLLRNLGQPTAFAYHGWPSWFCAAAAAAVTIFSLRDLAAARRCALLSADDPAPLAAALQRRHAILITGGTGFIGRRLVAALVAAGHDVTVLTRGTTNAPPAPVRIITHLDQLPDTTVIDAVVNLAGEPIADGLWTLARRRRILASRLRTTRKVIRFIARLERKPEVLVSGSAIGWYGVRRDERLDEWTEGQACFTRTVCRAWEEAAGHAEAMNVRTVYLRTGLVLGIEAGVLARMLIPFEFGLGGPFGDGRQWMSWIHRDDLVRLIVHAIATPGLAGALNAVAPRPVRNAQFARTLGRVLNRPAWIAVPAMPLRLLLGDFADELLLGGQRVIPATALRSWFDFLYPTLDKALANMMGQGHKPRAGAGLPHPNPRRRERLFKPRPAPAPVAQEAPPVAPY